MITMKTMAGYHSLAEGGNTIRRLSEKYEDLRPGDGVVMTYHPPDDENDLLAEEMLVVKSIAKCSFEDALRNHLWANHVFGPVVHDAEETGTDFMAMASEFFTEAYGDLEGEWMVIYF